MFIIKVFMIMLSYEKQFTWLAAVIRYFIYKAL